MENERRVQQKTPAGRYALLDELRGLDLVSMMLYHACWDMMFLFGIWMDWYAGMPGRLWQQSIGCSSCCPASACRWDTAP